MVRWVLVLFAAVAGFFLRDFAAFPVVPRAVGMLLCRLFERLRRKKSEYD
jgi:hypothetical protein